MFLGCTAPITGVESVLSKPESVAIPQRHSNDPPKASFTDFAQFVQNAITEDRIPGGALAIVSRDQVLLLEGYGLRDVEAGLPVTPDTLFHIGSTHKSLTALLLATLVDDGLLDWDTLVIDIDPEFRLADDDATDLLTVRHLLTMTSGIPDDAEEDLPDEPIPDDVFLMAEDAELLGLPGEVFSYSNPSYALAGYLAVLAVDGDRDDLVDAYAQLLTDRVLAPMGMNRATLFASDARATDDFSRSYSLDRQGNPVLAPSEDVDEDVLAPSGSLKASAREMALYVQTLLGRGLAPNGNRIVSEANLLATWQPFLDGYAMGWDVTDHAGLRLVSHEGSFDNFISVIGFLPDEDVGFVLLVNSEEAGADLIEEAPLRFAETFAD